MTPTMLMHELDGLVLQSKDDLPGHDLVEIQTKMSAIKYTLSSQLHIAEQRMLLTKDSLEKWSVKSRLALQAAEKMSNAKATDMVDADDETERLRLAHIDAKVEYSAIKNRIDNAKDVLVSLAGRISRLTQEQIESRFQQGYQHHK